MNKGTDERSCFQYQHVALKWLFSLHLSLYSSSVSPDKEKASSGSDRWWNNQAAIFGGAVIFEFKRIFTSPEWVQFFPSTEIVGVHM